MPTKMLVVASKKVYVTAQVGRLGPLVAAKVVRRGIDFASPKTVTVKVFGLKASGATRHDSCQAETPAVIAFVPRTTILFCSVDAPILRPKV